MIPKFKAWDTKKKRMSKPFYLGDMAIKWSDGDIDMITEFAVSKTITSGRMIFLSFTGLYDNTKWQDLTEEEREQFVTIDGNFPSEWKGKEIYQGDIVYYPHAKEQGYPTLAISVVEWYEDRWRLRSYSAECYFWGKMKVRGNKYEHPHLLKGNQK